ncbi:MAG: phosphoribosylformylglycinamidine synthase subunit PurQ, partial [Oxalobacter sp.]
KEVISPVSLIVSAFAPVLDVRCSLTPQLRTNQGDSVLLVVDLGLGKNRMGASALAQVTSQIGATVPDVDSAENLKAFFNTIQTLNRQGLLLAYHDRSDGGLFITLCEMAFAGHCGLDVSLDALADAAVDAPSDSSKVLSILFNEELGAVLQIRQGDLEAVTSQFIDAGLGEAIHYLGTAVTGNDIAFKLGGQTVYKRPRIELHRLWSETSWRIARLRDNPDCADQEYDQILNVIDKGISPVVPFDMSEDIAAPYINKGARPRVAILREQGSNSHVETAYVIHRAGFEAVDVHMTDLMDGRMHLDDCKGLIAVGGFSYGDVLGAGEGWAKKILFNDQLKEQFESFFWRMDTFALGICNGCQMMSSLAAIIPGAEAWPKFVRNRSEQFEARFSMVEVTPSPSIFFAGMAGLQTPIAVSHGEGRADFSQQGDIRKALVAMRYIDHDGKPTEVYPLNPNGSPDGITSVTTPDGRFTVMMPHAERVFRTVQNSWAPDGWGENSPWMRMFQNARKWVG